MQSLLTVTGEWAGELEIIIYVSLRRQPLLVVSPDQQGGRAPSPSGFSCTMDQRWGSHHQKRWPTVGPQSSISVPYVVLTLSYVHSAYSRPITSL
jgi:hypothetical protein